MSLYDYDRSVWWEEVDLALLDLLKNFHYVKNNKERVKVPVLFFPLSMNNEKYEYPIVMFRHLNEEFDLERYSALPVQVSIEDNVATYEDSARPYTLNYQLDIIAEKQRDLNYLTKQWSCLVPIRGTIPVVDTEGTTRRCFMSCEPPRQIDYYAVRGEDRLLRTVIKFKVKIELDMGTSYKREVVTQNPSISVNSD